MLIKCKECELQVSDKALSCPHCGYPMVKTEYTTKAKKKNKRRRLPNGFGQICEIKNQNLKNPYRAMVTVGKTDKGRFIVKPLKPKSYFETYNDAYFALMEYNKNPYDLDDDITVQQLYEKWTKEYFETLKNNSSQRTIKSAWSYCKEIYNYRVKELRAKHIKACMDSGPSANMKARIKSMFNLMLDYALENEVVDRNYARTFNVSENIIDEATEAKRNHIPFTDEEMKVLWENLHKKKYVDVILIQCFSGWRPGELGLIKLENVDLEQNIMTGGIKTKAGTNRIVPIHPYIRDLIVEKYNEAKELGSEYLINCVDSNNLKFTYDKYQARFEKICSELNLNPEHKAHDGRVHFVTLAKKNKLDEYAIKYIVGHSIQDLTERVYTKREIDWLISEMQK